METVTKAGRELMESRFGALGRGSEMVMIGDAEYDLQTLAFRMGLNFDDAKPIDIVTLSPQHFVFRYYDGEDQRIVAYEFNAQFVFLHESRAHIAEWIGEEAYHDFFRDLAFGCRLRPNEQF